MIKSTNGFFEGIGITRPDLLPKHPIWFTSFSTCNIFVLPEEKPPIKELLSITVEPEIRTSQIIKTPESVSFEGQMLEGNNLILEILFKQNIKYIADTSVQNIYMVYFESTAKSINVVLPTHHVQPSPEKYYEISQLYCERKITAKPYIEDIYGIIRNSKSIYVSISMFIDVTLKKI